MLGAGLFNENNRRTRENYVSKESQRQTRKENSRKYNGVNTTDASQIIPSKKFTPEEIAYAKAAIALEAAKKRRREKWYYIILIIDGFILIVSVLLTMNI